MMFYDQHSKKGKLKYMWLFGFLCLCLDRNETERKRVSLQVSNEVCDKATMYSIFFQPHVRKSNFSSYGFKQFKLSERTENKQELY